MNNKLLKYALLALTVFLVGLNFAEAKQLRIAVIDSGFGFDVELNKKAFKMCKTGSYDFIANSPVIGDDENGHGTAVLSLIERTAQTKNVCYLVFKVFDASGFGTEDHVNRAIAGAIKAKANVINMSLSTFTHSHKTKALIDSAVKRNIKVFLAAGNKGKNLNTNCNSYPSCYNIKNANLIRVGALDEDADVAKYSNKGVLISVYKYGRTMQGSRGTSFAAPRAAGDYVKSLNLDKGNK